MSISQETQDFDRLIEVMNKIPVVLFDRTSEKIPTIHVEAEDYRGAYLATRHLLNRKCRKIAHLAGPKKLAVSKNRLRGYRDALEEHDIPYDSTLVAHCEFNINKVPDALEKILKAHPDTTGIFAVNDEIAVEAILALKKLGAKIPEDFAIVGFGDYPIGRIVEPNLTTISHHPAKIGERATHHLIKLINHREEAAVMKEVIPCELIIRGSA
jgi:DNA-binding LacI/PurR family transcriptional regulator